jgi:hypothetical protein
VWLALCAEMDVPESRRHGVGIWSLADAERRCIDARRVVEDLFDAGIGSSTRGIAEKLSTVSQVPPTDVGGPS